MGQLNFCCNYGKIGGDKSMRGVGKMVRIKKNKVGKIKPLRLIKHGTKGEDKCE